jgi:hypothetical protein
MLRFMAVQKKTRRAWLYITEDDDARLQSLVKKLGPHYNDALILSTIASAGLKACEEEGSRLALPLCFKVVEESDTTLRLNEPSTPKRK